MKYLTIFAYVLTVLAVLAIIVYSILFKNLNTLIIGIGTAVLILSNIVCLIVEYKQNKQQESNKEE